MMKLLASTAALLLSLTFQAHAADAKAEKTASGIAITMLAEGAGANPKATDTVKVNYRGTLENGKEFDSSYSRGRPTELPLEALIPCWQEVLQQMKPGGAVRIVCPPETAYGSRGVAGKIPPDSTLNFVIELLEVKR